MLSATVPWVVDSEAGFAGRGESEEGWTADAALVSDAHRNSQAAFRLAVVNKAPKTTVRVTSVERLHNKRTDRF